MEGSERPNTYHIISSTVRAALSTIAGASAFRSLAIGSVGTSNSSAGEEEGGDDGIDLHDQISGVLGLEGVSRSLAL